MNLKLLWYCTKAKSYLTRVWKNQFELATLKEIVEHDAFNGKIVAVSNYDCEEIVHTYENKGTTHHRYNTKTFDNEQLLRKSRLFNQSLMDYLNDRNYDKNNNVVGYAIHIKNLEIFKEPKELKDIYIKGGYHNPEQMFTDEIQINGEWFHPMERAPQNMCYAYDKNGNKYVVISVRPKWLAMILNGLKTIEVRKKVLKEML